MRTSINIDDQLFLEAKKYALDSHKTFTRVIEDALRNTLAKKSIKKRSVTLVTMKGEGLKHGVDLDNNQSLEDIMDG